MRYAETSRYRACVDTVMGEVMVLEANLQELAKHKRGTPGIADQRAHARALMKTRKTRLAKLQSLEGFSTFELLHILAEMEGTTWTAEEAALWNAERSSYEGRGEKGLKMRFNLPQTSSLEEGDLGELGEVKCLQTASGETIQTIRLGRAGKSVFGRLNMLVIERGELKGMPDDVRNAFADGEVSGGMLYNTLPERIRSTYVEGLAPRLALGTYNAIFGTTEFGYVWVPKEEYDLAWRLVSVTKMSPRYALKREYVIRRINRAESFARVA